MQARLSRRARDAEGRCAARGAARAARACAIPTPEALLGFLREMEFATLTKRIAEGLGAEAPPPLDARRSAAEPRSASRGGCDERTRHAGRPRPRRRLDASAAGCGRAGSSRPSAKIDRSQVRDRDRRSPRSKAGSPRRAQPAAFAFDTETTSLDADAGRVRRLLAWRWRPARPATCRSGIAPAGGAFDFGDGDTADAGRRSARRSSVLKPLLEDPSVLKIGQNIKYDCAGAGASTASSSRRSTTRCCSPTRSTAAAAQHGMDELAERHLGPHLHPFAQVLRARARRQEVRQDVCARCRSTRRPNTPPRMPTSRCGCGWR